MKRIVRIPGREAGFLLPSVLSVIIASSIIGAAVLTVVLNNFFVIGNNITSQKAFNIAEAGINYYLWHLSHNPSDYKDGKSTPTTPNASLGYGPYVHNYVDSNAVTEGTFTLWINPQGGGSTVATIHSIGQVTGSSIVRTIDAKIGAASFASYGIVSDGALWFGPTETANGPVFSNQGIRMDGTNTSSVYSANSTYVPPTQIGGDGSSHPGVWCSSSVTTPVNCNTRNKSSWIYPYSSIDFNQVSSSLCTIKTQAFADDPSTASLATQSNACSQTPTTRTNAYIPQRSASVSPTKGYMIELNSGGTYNLYNVNGETDTLTPYTSALSLSLVASNLSISSPGIIFVEDNVWVRTNPTFHGRVTIAAGRLATSAVSDITIVDNLKYSVKDGSDSIGLLAKNDVYIAPYIAPTTGNFAIEVDAAVLGQTANVEFPGNYKSGSQTCTRGWVSSNQTFLFYGSVANRQVWTWSWESSGSCGNMVKDPVSGLYIGGFLYNTTQYDPNLLYTPPPLYPVTGGYNVLSWREVLNQP